MMNKDTLTSKEAFRLYRDQQTIENVSKPENSTYDNLKTGLTHIAMGRGLDAAAAAEAAEKVLNSVLAYEETARKVSEDPVVAVEETFSEMAALEPAQRLELMNKMYFALLLGTDEALSGQMKNGASYEDLYDDFRSRNDLSEEALRGKILDLVTGGSLTPDALDLLTESAASVTGDASFTQAAIGFGGVGYKALFAMHLYTASRNGTQPLTPEEAALKACATADIQGMADSFNAGDIIKVVCLMMTMALVIRIVVHAIKLIIAAATVKEILALALVAYLMTEGITELGVDFSTLASRATAAAVPMVKNGVRKFRDAMSVLREEAAEQQTETAAGTREETVSALTGLPLVEEEQDYRPLTSYI